MNPKYPKYENIFLYTPFHQQITYQQVTYALYALLLFLQI